MASYLYVLSIGPVQDFIAAARRTRDLWIGSYLLSEVSKAAAKKIKDERGSKLIFPNLEKKFLEPSESPDAPNVANVILAELELPDGADPAELNKRVQVAAKNEWLQYANGAKFLAKKMTSGFINETIWNFQVEDVLEFYSAWVPMPADKASYPSARKRLMQILAGRKATRNFIQPMTNDKLPKSSLDGARETVLRKENNAISKELALKMRLKAGEELCVVGLTKRLGGKRYDKLKMDEDKNVELEAFPSVVRVALDPWIRGITKSGGEAKELLDEIRVICKNKDFAQGSGWWQNREQRYPEFPFDGQILHLPRITGMIKAIEKSRDPKSKKLDTWKGWEAQLTYEDIDDLRKIEGLAKRLQKSGKTANGEMCFGFGEPERYYAVLVADGDRMGKVISASDREKHIRFSADLSKFANDARTIVRKHNGCMVYSGGDDVLAFLPLDCCLQAARELHDCFGRLLKEYKIDPDDKDQTEKTPTLSVGIAIGHSMEPLEDMLSFGKEAEKDAKKGEKIKYERNGLAVHIHPRSGAPIKIREQWKPKTEQIVKGHVLNWAEMGLDERLLKWAEMHCTNVLPDSVAYGMHELAEDYRNWDISSKEMERELPNLIAADIMRLLKRKKGGAATDSLKKENIEALLKAGDPREAVVRLADEMVLARRLGGALKQAKGKNCEIAKIQEVAS